MEVYNKMKLDIEGSFDQIRKALDMREKLLIRQLQVLEQQAFQFTKEEIEFIPDNEIALIQTIRTYGRINVKKLNVVCNMFLTSEDYICPQDDHVLINKQLIADTVVEGNANHLNESLINLILHESKELVGSQHNCAPHNKGGRHGNSDKAIQIIGDQPFAVTGRIPQTLVGDRKASKSASKRAIVKINESPAPCDSSKKKVTSSLRGISRLTNNSSTTSNILRRPTAIVPTVNHHHVDVSCDFYNRLINENEILKPKRNGQCIKTPMQEGYSVNPDISPVSTGTSDTSSTSFKGFSDEFAKQGLLGSYIEEVNPDPGNCMPPPSVGEAQPRQIQLWLKQIIHDSELEPVQSSDLLESRRIEDA